MEKSVNHSIAGDDHSTCCRFSILASIILHADMTLILLSYAVLYRSLFLTKQSTSTSNVIKPSLKIQFEGPCDILQHNHL